MARQIKRLSAKQKSEFEKLKRKVKDKVRRVKKNYGIDISGEIEIPQLSEFKTYEQLNEWKEKASSITNKNNLRFQFKRNQYGIVASKAELNEAERNYKRDLQNYKREIKALEKRAKAGDMKAKANLMLKKPNVRISKPAPFDFNNFITRDGLEDRFERLRERAEGKHINEGLERMRKNWLVAVTGSFNNEADDIIERVENMSDEDFFEFYDEFKNVMSFELYDSDGQDVDAHEGHLERIRHYLDKYDSGDMNPAFYLKTRK